MRRLFLFLGLVLPLLFFSQTRDKRSAPYTVRFNVGIPKSVSSQKFRTAFNGVVESNLSVSARLFTNFFVGLGYQYTHFQNNKEVFAYYRAKDPKGNNTGATLSYNTRLEGNAGFIKLGYDHFFEKGFVTMALNSGYNLMQYRNVVNDTSSKSLSENIPFVSTSFATPYVQPEISVSFMADRSLTFSLLFSYTTLLYKFDPKAPRFNGIGELKEKSNNYFISWINIGFGCTVLLGKR